MEMPKKHAARITELFKAAHTADIIAREALADGDMVVYDAAKANERRAARALHSEYGIEYYAD